MLSTTEIVGFYRRIDERTLKVGPYQGGHGCLTIDRDRGVRSLPARKINPLGQGR